VGCSRHRCVSTRLRYGGPVPGERSPEAGDRPPEGLWRADPAEQVALVARAKREGVLRAHRHRLRREDLEDCYSQATLELLARVQSGHRFNGRGHVANALEQRFVSRVRDRRRAVVGRSPLQTALEEALALGEPAGGGAEVVDVRAEVHARVVRHQELRRIYELAQELTADQRLVLATQVALSMERAEFCRRFGWSFEKYRKVAQRARARLRALLEHDAGISMGTGRTGAVPLVGVRSEREIGTHL
jgi:DNA-directed RNA polymerase specialized sigma24 family protein